MLSLFIPSSSYNAHPICNQLSKENIRSDEEQRCGNMPKRFYKPIQKSKYHPGIVMSYFLWIQLYKTVLVKGEESTLKKTYQNFLTSLTTS